MNGPRDARLEYEMKENNSSLRKAYLQDRLLPPSPLKDVLKSTEVSQSQYSDSDEELQSFYMTIDSDHLDQRQGTSPVHYQYANNQQYKKRTWPTCCQKMCLCFILLLIFLLSSSAASTGVMIVFFPNEVYNIWLKTFSSPFQEMLSESHNQNKLLLSRIEEQFNLIMTSNQDTQELLVTLLNTSHHGFQSCSSLKRISSTSPSGYYWVKGQSNISALLYCEMNQTCGGKMGGWTRVANLNFQDCEFPCPLNLSQKSMKNSTSCMCGINAFPPGCSSVIFSMPVTLDYTSICGRVTRYSRGSLEAFGLINTTRSLEDPYVDGISFTHGVPKSRVHIWTFAMAQNLSQCPSNNSEFETPLFVGKDYFCDISNSSPDVINHLDPLWDESVNSQEWFYKKMAEPTTESVELRLCSDDNRSKEDVAIEEVEIYVQ